MTEHQISQIMHAIGGLEQETKAVRTELERNSKSREAMLQDLREIKATLAPMRDHGDRIARLEGEQREQRDLRNKGTGIIIGAMIAAGATGTAIWTWAKDVFKWL